MHACLLDTPAVPPNPRPALLFLVLYAGLIAFGSLYPFTGLKGLEHWTGQFITAPLPRFITRNDISTNVLAYLPLGYALALHLGLPRRRLRARTEFLSEGDRPGQVSILHEGWACKLVMLPDGRRQIAGFLEAEQE